VDVGLWVQPWVSACGCAGVVCTTGGLAVQVCVYACACVCVCVW